MLTAADQAFHELFTPAFRTVLLKCVAFTIGLLAILIIGIEWTFSHFVQWPGWIEKTIEWLGGLALVAGSIFLIPPVSSLIAGLYVDDIAAEVERTTYPQDPPGKALATLPAIGLALNALSYGLLHGERFRIPGVLQRIGACIAIAGLVLAAGRVRTAAVACLGYMPVAEAAALAIPYLEDKSGTVRKQVLVSFAKRRDLLTEDAISRHFYDSEPGIPESFNVLIKEMQSLCLDVEVLAVDGREIEMHELDEDVFRTAEELGIDISRNERGSDEEDERRAAERSFN